jgi:O-antigen/teichoic acid export membrane protein
MNTAQRIIKNTVSLLCSGMIGQALALAGVIYLARVLGPGNFGKLNFALALSAYFLLAGNMGLPLWGTREAAADKSRLGFLVSHVVVLRLALAGLALLILAALALVLPITPEVRGLVLLYGLGMLPAALAIDWVIQAVEKMEVIGIARVLAAGCNLLLVVLLIKTPAQLLWIPVYALVATWLGSGILLAVFTRYAGKLPVTFRLADGLGILRQAWPMGVSMILIQVFFYIDTVMLGFMRTEEEIGYYNAGFKIMLFLNTCGGFYYDAIFPVVSHCYQTSLPRLKKLLTQTARLMLALAVPLGVGGTLLAGPLLNLVFGARFDPGVPALQILIWLPAIMYVNMIYDRGLWACGRQTAYLKIIALEAVLNVVLNIFLIPRLGIVGAAAAKLIVTLLGFGLYYWAFNRVAVIRFHPYILKPVLAAVVMAAFLALGMRLEWHVLILVGGGAVVYGLTLFGLRGITRGDLAFIRGLAPGGPGPGDPGATRGELA